MSNKARFYKTSKPTLLVENKVSILTFFQGVAIGVSEIIPGISGSTVALLFGIYDDFIELLFQTSEIGKNFLLLLIGKRSFVDVVQAFRAVRWKFALVLGFGMILSVAIFSQLIISLLISTPKFIYAFMLGVTLPTMYMVYSEIKDKSRNTIIIFSVTALLLLSLFIATAHTGSVTNPHPIQLFTGGMVAVSTMILPGVSGSFMLLVLGLYNFVINLLASLINGTVAGEELVSLGYIAAGVAVGFLTTVRVVRFAYNNYKNQLMAVLLGLLVSSLYVLWPFVKVIGIDASGEPILGKMGLNEISLGNFMVQLLIVAITATLITLLQRFANKRNVPLDWHFLFVSFSLGLLGFYIVNKILCYFL